MSDYAKSATKPADATVVGDKSAFHDALRAALAADGSPRPQGLVLVDLDHFKTINDAFGHARGDKVLAEFVERVARTMRAGDRLFRFGGDEYAVLLDGATWENGLAAAERIMDAVARNPYEGAPPIRLTTSIGLAVAPRDATDAEQLFAIADARLYAAKRAGRGRVGSRDAAELPEGTPTRSAEKVNPGRLIERDALLEIAYRAIENGEPGQQVSLGLVGGAGAGRSAMAYSLATRFELQGWTRIALRTSPALSTRALSAFGPWPAVVAKITRGELDAAVALLLRAAAPGTLVLIDDVQWLDEQSRELLPALLDAMRTRGRLALLLTFPTGWMVPKRLAPELQTVVVPPLGELSTRILLRSMIREEASPGLAKWVFAKTGGAPAAISRLLRAARTAGWRPGSRRPSPTRLARIDTVLQEEDVRSELPAALRVRSLLVGRIGEVRDLHRLLDEQRVVTLHGLSGVGKTMLARQALSERQERGTLVSVVSLEFDTSAERIAGTLLDSMGVPLASGIGPLEQLAQVPQQRPVLLFLDNGEVCLPEVTRFVARALQALRSVRVLIASQQRLWVAEETCLELSGLREENDAVEILRRSAARAGVQMSDAHGPALRKIADELDRHPLALELAGTLTRILQPHEVALAITRGQSEIVASPRRDVPARHQSLRGLWQHVWSTLDEELRTAAIGLGGFPSSFTIDAARRIAGVSATGIGMLVDRSLLQRASDGRFRVHSALRRFIEDHESNRTNDERSREFASYFSEWASRERGRIDGPEQTLSAAAIATELPNLLRAWALAVQAGDSPQLLPMAHVLARFYDLRHEFHEAETLFVVGARRLPEGSRTHAICLAHAGAFALLHGDYETAAARLGPALETLRRVGAPEEAAEVLWQLARVERARGNPAGVRLRARESLTLAGDVPSRGSAGAMLLLAHASRDEADYDAAQLLLSTAIAAFEALGDPTQLASALSDLAVIHAELGARTADQSRTRKAWEMWNRALALARGAGHRSLEGQIMNNVGISLVRDGNAEEGVAMLEDSVRIFRATGTRSEIAKALATLGEALSHTGDSPTAARAVSREALVVAAGVERIDVRFDALVSYALMEARIGSPYEAARLYGIVSAHPLHRALGMHDQIDELARVLATHEITAESASFTAASDAATAFEAAIRELAQLSG